MRISFGAKTYTYPQPVYLVATYDASGVPNVMTAAWGGISNYAEISLAIDHTHKTADNLVQRKAFTVSVGDEAHLKACDYVGMVSGHDVPDKFVQAGFTAEPSTLVDAPLIAELPLTLECKVISYDATTDKLVGEIVNVSADESIIGANGKIDPAKFCPLIYDPVNEQYLRTGSVAGEAFVMREMRGDEG